MELVSWLFGSFVCLFVFLLDFEGLRRVRVAQGSSKLWGFCSSDAELAVLPESYSVTMTNLRNMACRNKICLKLH